MAEAANVTPITEEAAPATSEGKRKVARSSTKFPVYSLVESVAVADAVHKRGGGSADHDHLAVYLGYKGPKNGSYINRVSAARLFGLVAGEGTITLTQRGQAVLMPQFPRDAEQALVDAFFSVPLYKAVFDHFKGQELPPEFGMKNAFRLTWGIVPGRLDQAYKAFIDSAETAGFFNTRGTRTQLIIPVIGAASPGPDQPPAPQHGGNGTGGPGGNGANGNSGSGHTPPAPPATSYDQMKLSYVQTLIDMMKEGKEVDPAVSEKIERLLGLMESTQGA